MAVLDQSLMWKSMEERLARTTNPRHRHMIEMVIAHSKSEVAGDIEAVLATLAPDPAYHLWSDGRDVGPKGMEAVVGFYQRLLNSGGTHLESPKERIVVDDDTVVTEMSVRQILHGRAAKANGYDIDDEDAFYVIRFRCLVLWPFTPEGKIVGEDSYVSRDINDIRKLDDAEVPQSLRGIATGSEDAYTFT